MQGKLTPTQKQMLGEIYLMNKGRVKEQPTVKQYYKKIKKYGIIRNN